MLTKAFAASVVNNRSQLKPVLDFELPVELEAGEPPEARGLARDDVRLLMARRNSDEIEHAEFRDIGRFLIPGDLLVINTSGTMNAALPARREDGSTIDVHLSTQLPDGLWSIELRLPQPKGAAPFRSGRAGETLRLPGGGSLQLVEPYGGAMGAPRLWKAKLFLLESLQDYLGLYGSPIRYGYVRDRWPLSCYQTVFATEAGSAEMPSAGRAFTPEIVTSLVAKGVQFAPLLLHTGVASLEDHEPPYAEFYRVPESTAQLVNFARRSERRVIAVGTTAVRALESVADESGEVRSGEGWTELIISPSRGVRAVDGLLTGLHEPRATHLAMLEAFVSRDRLRRVYAESLQRGYRWHEFGDLHLFLP